MQAQAVATAQPGAAAVLGARVPAKCAHLDAALTGSDVDSRKGTGNITATAGLNGDSKRLNKIQFQQPPVDSCTLLHQHHFKDTNKHDINPQVFPAVHIIDNTSELLVVLFHSEMGHAAYVNAKESLQLARGYLTRPYLDWTGDMCGDFKNQAVYVGFLSAQTERILDSSSRDGAGVCCVGMFLSTQLHEQANTQAFSKWLDLMTLLHSDANNIFKAFQTDCDKAERLATARVNQGCSPKQLCREQEAELLKANPDMSGFIGLYIDRFHAHGTITAAATVCLGALAYLPGGDW
ncbi:hypothetical protein WJX77_005529 [Trebouxia sp. C0004]